MRKIFIISTAIIVALRNGRRTKWEISLEVGCSEARVKQLLSPLKSAGLVHLVHGRGGGYELAVPYSNISLGIINNALEQHFIPPQVDWIYDAISCELLSIPVSDIFEYSE